jgi:hypothetical protein
MIGVFLVTRSVEWLLTIPVQKSSSLQSVCDQVCCRSCGSSDCIHHASTFDVAALSDLWNMPFVVFPGASIPSGDHADGKAAIELWIYARCSSEYWLGTIPAALHRLEDNTQYGHSISIPV